MSANTNDQPYLPEIAHRDVAQNPPMPSACTGHTARTYLYAPLGARWLVYPLPLPKGHDHHFHRSTNAECVQRNH